MKKVSRHRCRNIRCSFLFLYRAIRLIFGVVFIALCLQPDIDTFETKRRKLSCNITVNDCKQCTTLFFVRLSISINWCGCAFFSRASTQSKDECHKNHVIIWFCYSSTVFGLMKNWRETTTTAAATTCGARQREKWSDAFTCSFNIASILCNALLLLS